jgi:hypothetical protein
MACPVLDVGIAFYADPLQIRCRNILSFRLQPLAMPTRCLFRDTGNELVRLLICMCVTKDVRKNVAHSLIQVWIA